MPVFYLIDCDSVFFLLVALFVFFAQLDHLIAPLLQLFILNLKLQGQRFVEFGDLFDPSRGQQVLVVTFIAMLELAKETLIELTQAEAFAPIYVRLAYTPA